MELEKNDRDLIIRIDERTKLLQQQFDAHLKAHFKQNLAVWSIVLSALVAFVVMV